jgi:hypothetical protein
MSCSHCSGSGWIPKEVEGEQVFYLCGCRAEGAIPFPRVCRHPECREVLSQDEALCEYHRAEWDAISGVEAWRHAEKVMRTLEALFALVGSDEEQEAIEKGVLWAEKTAAGYEKELSRLGKGSV